MFDQAILQFRYALQIWKNEDIEGISNLYNTIGFTYAETEQYELAIYYYQEALKNDENYTVAMNNLGYAYEKQRMINEAEGYAIERVNNAKGDIALFNNILVEYNKSPEITRDRLYIEAMEGVLGKISNKVIIDPELENFLPLMKIESKEN